MKKPTTKTPNPIDIEVGNRVRQRRIEMGISQEELGKKLGLTFQQVQKYEKGSNRIAASRLVIIAKILKVDVPYFFEDISPNFNPSNDDTSRSAFLASNEGSAMVRAVMKLDPAVIRSMTRLAETIGDAG